MTRLCVGLAALCALALLVLAARPDFDLVAARVFYGGTAHFVGDTGAGVIIRYSAWALPFLVWVVLLLAWIGRRLGLFDACWSPTGRSVLFLTLSMAIGPGLLVHGTLKEISHRPRPTSVAAFGGHDAFRPFFAFDGVCRHNCSFPSGETAAASWMLAPASLVPQPWTGAALTGAVVFASATGLLRMAFGAHFLSDILGAALITILVVLATRFLMKTRSA